MRQAECSAASTDRLNLAWKPIPARPTGLLQQVVPASNSKILFSHRLYNIWMCLTVLGLLAKGVLQLFAGIFACASWNRQCFLSAVQVRLSHNLRYVAPVRGRNTVCINIFPSTKSLQQGAHQMTHTHTHTSLLLHKLLIASCHLIFQVNQRNHRLPASGCHAATICDCACCPR